MPHSLRLSDIASITGAELIGDPNAEIFGLCPLDEPIATHLSFTKDIAPKNLTPILTPLLVRALIVPQRINRALLPTQGNFLLAADPFAAIVKLIALFYPAQKPSGKISDRADIHPSAKIAAGVSIGAFVAIAEDVIIEEGVVIHPHVTIYRGVRIGKGCLIHSGVTIREECQIGPGVILQNGAIIGADGFGYMNESKPGSPMLTKVPQVGTAVLGPCCEVGANSCVDRAALGTTQIGAHTKLDNLVQVGHNTKIGAFSIACGMVGIAGSCKIGNGVVLGGNVGLADHLTIADGVRLGAKSGVISDITEKGDYAGFPPVRALSWRRQLKAIAELPEIIEDLKKLLIQKNQKKES